MSKYLIENLFGIEGWSIAWYGVIIAVGMVLGVILAIYRARKQGLKDDLIFDFILLALPIAIICARGYYVVFEWNSYSGDILSIFKIWKGGLVVYGGVIGGRKAGQESPQKAGRPASPLLADFASYKDVRKQKAIQPETKIP